MTVAVEKLIYLKGSGKFIDLSQVLIRNNITFLICTKKQYYNFCTDVDDVEDLPLPTIARTLEPRTFCEQLSKIIATDDKLIVHF